MQGKLQVRGAATIRLVEQPAELVATTTMLVAEVTLRVFPLMVAPLAVTTASLLKLTLYPPVAVLQMGCPTVSIGVAVQEPGAVGVQLVGLTTVRLVRIGQPTASAVTIRLVPEGMLVMVVPTTVPAEAVTTPLLAKATLYVLLAVLQTGRVRVNNGAVQDGQLVGDARVTDWGGQVPLLAVMLTGLPSGMPVMLPAVTVPTEAVTEVLAGAV